MIIVKTIGGAMLQDTIAGRHYTPRSPHLTEMNSFVESFANAQNTGLQGSGTSVRRPKALLVLVGSEKLENLNDGVKDSDLKDAWAKYTASVRKNAGEGKAGQKAVDELSDDEWKKFAEDWVRQNSNGKKKKVEAPAEEQEGNADDKNPADKNGGKK